MKNTASDFEAVDSPTGEGSGGKVSRGAATSDSLLRAALRLMAANGYHGVSVRKICQEADVNLALLTYHFNTKAGVLRAIFERWATGINGERMRMLKELDERYPEGDPPLEDLLEAFIGPTFAAASSKNEDELNFLRLSGRLATDPTHEVREAIAAVYDEAAALFTRRLRQTCPHLSEREFLLRLVFLYGAMVYTRSQTGRVDSLAATLMMAPPDPAGPWTTRYLIKFLAAGLRLPATDDGDQSKTS